MNQKGLAKIYTILIIIVVIAGGVWAYFYFQKNDKSCEANETATACAVDFSNNQTNNLRTYLNTDYGYRLKYPKDWEYQDDAQGNPAMFYDSQALKQNQKATELLQGSKIEIYVEEIDNTSLDEVVLTKDTDFTILSETGVLVDNVPAIRRTVQTLSYTNVTYVVKNSWLYSIVQYIPLEKEIENKTKVYEELINNFIFLDLGN